MTSMPNFFIVGAPRAGTTSLYDHLRAHPDIYMSPVKEPHYFCEFQRELVLSHPITKEGDYLKLFQGAVGKLAVGEASTHYLYDERAPERIKQAVPNAKIIILLREPVGRAYSHFLLYTVLGYESKQFFEAVQEDDARTRKVVGAAFLYFELGLYYQQVRRYLDIFGADQVRVYLQEDMESDATGLLSDVCDFLGVPFADGCYFSPDQVHNAFATPRNAVAGWIYSNRYIKDVLYRLLPSRVRDIVRERFLLERAQGGDQKPPLDPRAEELLRSRYRDDTLKLQDLIGRDLSSWLA